MQIDLICFGKNMPVWVNTGFKEYIKRFSSNCHLTLVEIPLRKRTKQADLIRLQRQEGQQMLAAIAQGSYVVALDEQGENWSTLQLADQLTHWRQEYTRIALLVGGPEGLPTVCLQKSQKCWSLSALTFPHPLVRIIVAEQLYRAWTLLNNHPYHRG